MNKIIAATVCWWNHYPPKTKTALAISYEISVCLLLCGNAAIAVYDLQRGIWQGWFCVAVMLLLSIATVGRNYSWGKLIQAQEECIELLQGYLKNENSRDEQLGNIPLPVIALKMLIENGLPINSESLNRALDALRKSPDISTMN